MHYKLKGRPGFTVVELLIVIVVIAILATITTAAYTRLPPGKSALTQTS